MLRNLRKNQKKRLFNVGLQRGTLAPIDLGEHPFKADCNVNVAEKLRIKKHGIGMKKCPKFERHIWDFSRYGPKCPNPQGKNCGTVHCDRNSDAPSHKAALKL